jgi:hypothetical protein
MHEHEQLSGFGPVDVEGFDIRVAVPEGCRLADPGPYLVAMVRVALDDAVRMRNEAALLVLRVQRRLVVVEKDLGADL